MNFRKYEIYDANAYSCQLFLRFKRKNSFNIACSARDRILCSNEEKKNDKKMMNKSLRVHRLLARPLDWIWSTSSSSFSKWNENDHCWWWTRKNFYDWNQRKKNDTACGDCMMFNGQEIYGMYISNDDDITCKFFNVIDDDDVEIVLLCWLLFCLEIFFQIHL